MKRKHSKFLNRLMALYFVFSFALFGFTMLFMLWSVTVGMENKLMGLFAFSIFGGTVLGQVVKGCYEIGMMNEKKLVIK